MKHALTILGLTAILCAGVMPVHAQETPPSDEPDSDVEFFAGNSHRFWGDSGAPLATDGDPDFSCVVFPRPQKEKVVCEFDARYWITRELDHQVDITTGPEAVLLELFLDSLNPVDQPIPTNKFTRSAKCSLKSLVPEVWFADCAQNLREVFEITAPDDGDPETHMSLCLSITAPEHSDTTLLQDISTVVDCSRQSDGGGQGNLWMD